MPNQVELEERRVGDLQPPPVWRTPSNLFQNEIEVVGCR
jgi:hypothetical protein